MFKPIFRVLMGFAVVTTFVACETQTTTQHTTTTSTAATTAAANRPTTIAQAAITQPAATPAKPKGPWSRGTQTGTNL